MLIHFFQRKNVIFHIFSKESRKGRWGNLDFVMDRQEKVRRIFTALLNNYLAFGISAPDESKS